MLAMTCFEGRTRLTGIKPFTSWDQRGNFYIMSVRNDMSSYPNMSVGKNCYMDYDDSIQFLLDTT